MKKEKNNNSIKFWLIYSNVIIVIASIMIYELVDFFTNYIVNKNYDYKPIAGVGMIIPMSILIYFLTTNFTKKLYTYIYELINGISKISLGDFTIKLDEKKAGPFKDVYHNFNMMSDELGSIETLRNDFINEFSHEFKTPLSSINGFSSLLLEGNCSKEDTIKYLKIIERESERLVLFTKNQLLLSNLDSKNIIQDKKSFSLDEQIRHCVILLVNEWESKNLDINIELEKMQYFGNQDIMEHVWLNLLNNAIKYTPENGEIFISSHTEKDRIEISIKDTGIGMTEEEIDNIFRRYYKVNNNSSSNSLGLGLPIVKRIIELNNGTIKIDSKIEEGSTFKVVLPR